MTSRKRRLMQRVELPAQLPTPLRGTLRPLLCLGLALLATTLFAEGLEVEDSTLAGDRPNASGAATEVRLDVFIFDIDEIDDVKQRFSADVFAHIAWHDPRLALPIGEQKGQIRSIPLNDIWTPRGMLLNDRGLTRLLPYVVQVDDQGNVQYVQRLTGDLAADLDFKEFPFDVQTLPIDIISYQHSPQEVFFSQDVVIGSRNKPFSIEGWRLTIMEPEYGEFLVPSTGAIRPRLTHFVTAKRNTQYYFFTMFLPMTLIVFMAWTAFWLQPDIVPARMAISTASIFSLIAFGFSIRMSLPPVSYMTRADQFTLGCTLLVFLALGVSVAGSRMASSDRMKQALRLNAAARWVYVILFLFVAATSLLL
ncbi:MAG: hypothetical protein ACR2P6_10095 [Gammaproteobacteria bacterium]